MIVQAHTGFAKSLYTLGTVVPMSGTVPVKFPGTTRYTDVFLFASAGSTDKKSCTNTGSNINRNNPRIQFSVFETKYYSSRGSCSVEVAVIVSMFSAARH